MLHVLGENIIQCLVTKEHSILTNRVHDRFGATTPGMIAAEEWCLEHYKPIKKFPKST